LGLGLGTTTQGETQMRSATLIAAGLVLAATGPAFAANAPSSATSNMPATDAPMQSTAPATQTPPATTGGATTTPPTGSASDTSATAGPSTAAPPALSVGEPVKDNSGATIGAISSLSTNSNGQQMAVIKMGNDTFQVASDKLGAMNGSAEINLSQAQITSMLHPAAGGR
jgi:hypothetical protein